MTEENERLVVLIGDPKELYLLNEGLNKAGGYCAPILSASVARVPLKERGSEVDLIIFQTEGPKLPDVEETFALIAEFTPLCPNAKILVYGSSVSKEKFSGQERLVFVEAPVFLSPSRLRAKVEEIFASK